MRSYKKAYDSMKSCPLYLEHPSEAQVLHGLGPRLCDRLFNKLKKHCSQNGLPVPERSSANPKRKSDEPGSTSLQAGSEITCPSKRRRKPKPYIPALRSGPYALLYALGTTNENARQGLTKGDLIELAQPHCDSSFTAPSDPTKHFTAWSSMKTLLGKDLVLESGRPTRTYMLTEEGWEVVKRIKDVKSGSIETFLASAPGDDEHAASGTSLSRMTSQGQAQGSGLNDGSTCRGLHDASARPLSEPPEGHRQTQPSTQFPPNFQPVVLPPGAFEVLLVLDSREVRTVKDREYISEQLAKQGIPAVTRALPLGDALWIARPTLAYEHVVADANNGADSDGFNEIVLDHVVERKRLDDLIFSIKDGRFHEQKFRLRRSGIGNVTYLIENFSISAEQSDKYGETLESAIATTQVVNGYFVKETEKLDDSITYLVKMSRMLKEMYESRSLFVIPSRVLDPRSYCELQAHLRAEQPEQVYHITFSSFSSLCSKTDAMSLRDIFLRMLMCIRGVTGEKALEIQKKWRTPIEFFGALETTPPNLRAQMIVDAAASVVAKKKIAPKLGARIADIWT